MYIIICEIDFHSRFEAWDRALSAGTTLRDEIGREMGAGFRMGDTNTPKDNSWE